MDEKRFALIISSYQYEDPDLKQLVAPAQDAEALAHVLSDPNIGDFDVKTILNEPSHKVSREIEAFFIDRKRGDLLLLYFSGHGIKDEEGHLYFATTDTNRRLLRTTSIPASLINEMIRRSRSRKQVLLLDCCYSGAFARGMVVKANKAIGIGEYFKEGRGQVVLTASDAMQYSFEGEDIKGEGMRSVFTNILVKGLETGKADLDNDGYISIDDMYEYVYDRVTKKMPQQEPRKWAFDVKGSIVIARNPRRFVESLPYELQVAIEYPISQVRMAAADELVQLLQSDDKGLVLAAREALNHLTRDRSCQVSTLATEILSKYTKYDEKMNTKALEEAKLTSITNRPTVFADEKRQAVIVGINEYKDPEIPKLNGAVNDAVEVWQKLKYFGNFNVTSNHFLLDSKATFTAIREAISDLLYKTDLCDVAIFYFSGHGFVDAYHEGYLAPWDMLRSDPFVYGLKVTELKQLIRNSVGKATILIILDCSYSGIAIEGIK